VGVGLVDMGMRAGVLAGMMVYYGIGLRRGNFTFAGFAFFDYSSGPWEWGYS